MNWPLVPSLTSSSHPLSWVKHHLPVAHTDLCLPRNGKYWMGFACTPGSLSPAGVSPQTSVQPAFNWNRPMMHKGQPCSLMLLFPQSPRPLMPKKQSCPPRPFQVPGFRLPMPMRHPCSHRAAMTPWFFLGNCLEWARDPMCVKEPHTHQRPSCPKSQPHFAGKHTLFRREESNREVFSCSVFWS